jgi:hypothetical protein
MSDDRFTDHIPAIVGAACGTVAASVGASFLGVAGTFAGLALGSVITGTAAWFIERWVRRGRALAAAKAKAIRERGGLPLNEHETQIIKAIEDKKQGRGIHWRVIAGIAGFTLLLSVVAIGSWELASGRTVDRIVRPPAPTSQQPTLPPSHAPSSPRPSPSPTFSPSLSPSPSPSLSPSVSPSAQIIPSTSPPASPSLSVTPSVASPSAS